MSQSAPWPKLRRGLVAMAILFVRDGADVDDAVRDSGRRERGAGRLESPAEGAGRQIDGVKPADRSITHVDDAVDDGR